MGIRVVDSSVGGLGGCPYAKNATGNVGTEKVLQFLQTQGMHTVSLSHTQNRLHFHSIFDNFTVPYLHKKMSSFFTQEFNNCIFNITVIPIIALEIMFRDKLSIFN